eukprot:scaffold24102_cov153-Isochrysis_galbana.AAC.2
MGAQHTTPRPVAMDATTRKGIRMAAHPRMVHVASGDSQAWAIPPQMAAASAMAMAPIPSNTSTAAGMAVIPREGLGTASVAVVRAESRWVEREERARPEDALIRRNAK